jgi:hypothetical protein
MDQGADAAAVNVIDRLQVDDDFVDFPFNQFIHDVFEFMSIVQIHIAFDINDIHVFIFPEFYLHTCSFQKNIKFKGSLKKGKKRKDKILSF